LLQIQTVGPWSELDALASALDHHHIIANQVHDLHARSKDAAVSILYDYRLIARDYVYDHPITISLSLSLFFFFFFFFPLLLKQLAGYLEQQFTGKHANKIRELSGLLTNLVPMYKESAGRDLAHYLFDQKLLA